MSEPCALLGDWLQTPAGSADDSPLPDSLVDHVAGCPRCRGALIALLADRIGPDAAPDDRSCAAIEAELPGFVDDERARGLIRAARALPDVWWHTLVCPRCDALYRSLHTLAATPEEPWRVPAPAPNQRPTIWAHIQLRAEALRQLLSAEQRLGMAWGDPQAETLVAEEDCEISLIQVSLRHEPPARVALVIRTDPPVEGEVLLAVGAASYREPLDDLGYAVFSGLATALFVTPSGPEIVLTIRPAQV